MPSYVTPKKNVAFVGYCGLVDQSNTKLLKVNPTLAAGDVKVSVDGGAFANITTLPTVAPAGGTGINLSLSAAEMNGDNIVVAFSDVAGAEWCDLMITIQTTAQQINDLASTSVAVAVSTVADLNAANAEPAAVPAANATILQKLAFMAALLRNKITVTGTTQLLRNDADNATIATAAVSDDGTTFTRGQMS